MEPLISAQLRTPIITFLNERGLRATACRRRLALWNPEGQIAMSEAIECLDLIYRECPEPGLAICIAEKINLNQLGVLSYLLLSCDNLGEVFISTMRCYRMVWEGFHVEIPVTAESLTVRWRAVGESFEAPQLLYAIGMAGIVRLLRLLVGEGLTPLRVVVPEPKELDLDLWNAFFQCPIEFEGATAALSFAIMDMQLPVRHNGDLLRQSVERQIETQLSKAVSDNDFLHGVQQLIVRGLREGDAGIRRIAAQMSLSESTLHRRIVTRGSTFRQLLDDTRYSLAQVYLRDPSLSLAEISWLLAFSEQSAFTRSFRRRAGISPGQFRSSRESSFQ